MTYKTLRRILNWSLAVLPLFVFLCFFFLLGAASVGTYFSDALVEVRKIEEKGLLNALPENTSFMAKDAISFLDNSENIQNYVLSVERDFAAHLKCSIGFSFLFLFSLSLRLWFRKNKFGNDTKVKWPFRGNR